MSSIVVRRLVITIALALAYLVASELVWLPNVNPEAMGLAVGRRYIDGVFALGITPVLSAYVTVEVVAFIVPRWSRLRHENPAGRARLDRAVMFVAIALAAIQGLSMSLTLETAPVTMSNAITSGGWEFRAVTTATLIGGVVTSVLVAWLISAQRIANGFVVLGAALALRDFLDAVGRGTHVLPPPFTLAGTSSGPGVEGRDLLVACAAIGVVVYALLRCFSASRAPSVTVKGRANAYRAAQTLLVHPVVPVPGGSIQAFFVALWLLSLPATLRSLHVDAPAVPHNVGVQLGLTIVLATAVNAIFARAMHRPSELDALARKVGAEIGGEATKALRDTYPPSVLFFFVLTVADHAFALATRTSLAAAPLIVAAVVDVVDAARRAGEREWVVVWVDRRVAAAHAIRALLECHGIEARIEGLAVLWLFQAFVPFAPARIVVPGAERAEAESVLARLLPGGEPNPTKKPANLRAPSAGVAQTLTRPLAACAFVAVLVMILAR